MRLDSWTCVMVRKGPGIIPDDVKNHLQISAGDLYLKKWDRMRIVGDGACNGIIETDWKRYHIGVRSGILFRSQVDSKKGEYLVNFLLREDNLETSASKIRSYCEENSIDWRVTQSTFPLRELYEFRNLRQTRLGTQLN